MPKTLIAIPCCRRCWIIRFCGINIFNLFSHSGLWGRKP